MMTAYKLLLQTEKDVHNGTAGQKKVELNTKRLKENGTYSPNTPDEQIIRDQMHKLLDSLLDEYLFVEGE